MNEKGKGKSACFAGGVDFFAHSVFTNNATLGSDEFSADRTRQDAKQEMREYTFKFDMNCFQRNIDNIHICI